MAPDTQKIEVIMTAKSEGANFKTGKKCPYCVKPPTLRNTREDWDRHLRKIHSFMGNIVTPKQNKDNEIKPPTKPVPAEPESEDA